MSTAGNCLSVLFRTWESALCIYISEIIKLNFIIVKALYAWAIINRGNIAGVLIAAYSDFTAAWKPRTN